MTAEYTDYPFNRGTCIERVYECGITAVFRDDGATDYRVHATIKSREALADLAQAIPQLLDAADDWAKQHAARTPAE